MRTVLGFDGGGTKTDCVLMEESGKIVARGQGGPSNPLRVGFGAAIAAVRHAAQQAMAEANFAGGTKADAICAGLAGAGPPESAEKVRVLLSAEFPGTKILVCTDIDLALATAGEGSAMVLVAGTGSFAVGRNAAGETARAGGYGSQIGDEGSAYDIGRRAVLTAMHENDRSGADSALGKRLLQELGCTTWAEVQARAQAASDEVFPRLFSVVAMMADRNDETAQGILRAGAADLASLVENLAARLKMGEGGFFLAKTGGMMGRSRYLEGKLDERLKSAFGKVTIGETRMPPAEAAARMALELISNEGGVRA